MYIPSLLILSLLSVIAPSSCNPIHSSRSPPNNLNGAILHRMEPARGPHSAVLRLDRHVYVRFIASELSGKGVKRFDSQRSLRDILSRQTHSPDYGKKNSTIPQVVGSSTSSSSSSSSSSVAAGPKRRDHDESYPQDDTLGAAPTAYDLAEPNSGADNKEQRWSNKESPRKESVNYSSGSSSVNVRTENVYVRREVSSGFPNIFGSNSTKVTSTEARPCSSVKEKRHKLRNGSHPKLTKSAT